MTLHLLIDNTFTSRQTLDSSVDRNDLDRNGYDRNSGKTWRPFQVEQGRLMVAL